jgi:hypothetical protein
MFNSFPKSTGKGLIIVFALIVISVPFQERIDDIRGEFRSIEETLYLSSSNLKKLSLGYKEIIADIYWMRALQYFGSQSFAGAVEQAQANKLSAKPKSDLLYHYFDIITDLDPRFVNAYRYGGTFISEPSPIGLDDIEKGTMLFDKGRNNNPANFRLPLEEAFIYYLYAKDYQRAADLFKDASQKPGLTDFRRASLRGMAALAQSKGGNKKLSRQIWKIIYETTTDEGRKNFALRNLKEVDTMDIEERLTEALREYVSRYNETPKSLEVLKDASIIREVPKEPLGGKFVILGKLREVKSSTLLDEQIQTNLAYLNAKAHKFKTLFGIYPKDLVKLREFIEKEERGEYPPNPLGEEYVYNPEAGKVESK